jgi:hypothetical protein
MIYVAQFIFPLIELKPLKHRKRYSENLTVSFLIDYLNTIEYFLGKSKL